MTHSHEVAPGEDRRLADLELVRATLAGDPRARAAFAERMEVVPRLLAIANARMGRPLSTHDLSDLAQDTLIRIWRKLATYEGRATLAVWAHRFCYLELMNALRARSRRSQVSRSLETLVPSPPPSQASPLEYEQVELALEQLGPPRADVIRLKHYEGLTFAEIGERLSMPTGTAKTLYYRGLRWLRGKLSGRIQEAGQ